MKNLHRIRSYIDPSRFSDRGSRVWSVVSATPLTRAISVELYGSRTSHYCASGLAVAALIAMTDPAHAAGGDFSTTDFSGAAPYTYNHNTGGGAYNDRTVGDYKDITEQLEGGQFACGDTVTYLAAIEVAAHPADANQTAEFDFSFLGDSTGQSGAAITDILDVRVNRGAVENGDNGTGINPGAGHFGSDSGIADDGGSTATLVHKQVIGTLFTPGSEVTGTVRVTDLEAGEKIVVRIDTRLSCKPGSSPTGNLQGQLDAGRVVEANGSPVTPADTINTGQQTIPFLKIGELAGAGEPLIAITKTVTAADGICGVDDVEQLSVTVGQPVKYCYVISNGGTATLYDVTLKDDNGTPGDTNDDFTITLSGLTNLDGQTDALDLAAGGTATGQASVTLSSSGTVINVGTALGNNGKTGGNLKLLMDTDTATVVASERPNQPPVANDDNATTNENQMVTIDVAGNDTDADGNLIDTSVSVVSGPSNGALVNHGDGTFSYGPKDGFTGTDSFEYSICDSEGQCDTAMVTIYVAPVNKPPLAVEDKVFGSEDTPLTINVLGNDSDPEGGTLSIQSFTEPTHGSVTQNADGSFTYTPDANFHGSDSFTYTVCDSFGLCNTAVVTVELAEVNDPPVANNDFDSTNEDTAVVVGVAGNDSDIDGNLDPSSVSVVSQPENGTVVPNADGTLTYTPNLNFSGADSFSYQICDTKGVCDTATVAVTVNPVNDPPVANPDSASTDEDVPVVITVTANDSDVDGNLNPASASVVSGPSHGSITGNGDGTFTYTPSPDYHGNDSFIYQVCDSDGACSQATVTIAVASLNDPPVANDDSFETQEDVPATINVAGNDVDVDGNLVISSILVLSSPIHGTLTNNENGSILYTPYPNYNGPDGFSYQICDSEGQCDSATVSIIVTSVNDPPVALDNGYVTPQDTALTIAAPEGVLTNDSDIDGDALTTSAPASTNFGGSVALDSDGSFSYTPAAGFAGYDTFTYKVSDGNGGTDTAVVTIEVQAKNGRSISVNWGDWTSSGTSLAGYFILTNQSSGGYAVQIIAQRTEVEYKASSAKSWTPVDVAGCSFAPSEPWLLTTQQTVRFTGCQLRSSIPSGTTVRVTAIVDVYGHKDRGQQKVSFLARLSK